MNINKSSFKDPQVSIGMPVYNGEKYICEALDSILAQSFNDFELIISDNASTDGTEAICKEYSMKDSRIRYVRQSVNRGGVANFKFVLDSASAKYFMWAAADDVWSENWIEVLIRNINDSDLCVLSACQMGGNIKLTIPRCYKIGENLKFYFDHWRTGKCMYIYGLFNAKKLKKLNFNIFKRGNSGDWLLLMSGLNTGGMRCVLGGQVYYRTHDESVSSIEESKKSYLMNLVRFAKYETMLGIIEGNPHLKAILLILCTPMKIVHDFIHDLMYLKFKK